MVGGPFIFISDILSFAVLYILPCESLQERKTGQNWISIMQRILLSYDRPEFDKKKQQQFLYSLCSHN